MSKVTPVIAAALVVGAVVLLAYDGGRGFAKAPRETATSSYVGPAPKADKDVIALFDGLKPGDELASHKVLAIAAPAGGVAVVTVQAGERVFSIGVQKRAKEMAKLPPVTTSKYAIGYGELRGEGDLPPGAMGNAAEALAERIRKRENDVPTPSGM